MKPNLIKKINKYFHDEESRYFSGRHESRMRRESSFYSNLFSEFHQPKHKNLTMLDIGSGTGLIGSILPGNISKFVCADISHKMLRAAKDTLGVKKSCVFNYVACDAEELPFNSGTFDIITCNAAIHHFPSVKKFALEAYRVLALGGTLVVGFESNRKFWSNKPLSMFYRIIARMSLKRTKCNTPYSKICEEVNNRLISEGVILNPISDSQILEYVDFHSPNAGDSIDYDKGFDISELLNEVFRKYNARISYHYDSIPGPVAFINKIFWPECAPQFSLILKK